MGRHRRRQGRQRPGPHRQVGGRQQVHGAPRTERLDQGAVLPQARWTSARVAPAMRRPIDSSAALRTWVRAAQHTGDVARAKVGGRLGQRGAGHPPGRHPLQVSEAGVADLVVTDHILAGPSVALNVSSRASPLLTAALWRRWRVGCVQERRGIRPGRGTMADSEQMGPGPARPQLPGRGAPFDDDRRLSRPRLGRVVTGHHGRAACVPGADGRPGASGAARPQPTCPLRCRRAVARLGGSVRLLHPR